MDPNATLLALLEAIATQDFEEAHAALDELEFWLGRGGFAPTNLQKALDALKERS